MQVIFFRVLGFYYKDWLIFCLYNCFLGLKCGIVHILKICCFVNDYVFYSQLSNSHA